jgi:hypothetical protein
MARFPKIDQPCPLDIDEQRRIAGDCGRCGKPVHALDAMGDAERLAWMRAAKGPVCVTYRISARGAALGLGAALALSAPVGRAQSTPPPAASDLQTPAPIAHPIGGAEADASVDGQRLETITITGGVSDPATVEFIDAADALPDMPVLHEAPTVAPR